MVGLDTNVLVRFLVDDDEAQGARARRLIGSGEAFFIPLIVLCELVWVLDRAYAFDRASIATALDRLLAADKLEIERADDVRDAVEEFRAGRADFADALIGLAARDTGCTHVATFDRRLKKSPLFEQL